ncbi:MAG: nucleoside deaminase, partial [Xanthomonadaceae bacterium]|nr:nucleoside deaminase [Xanthomonadaceae bacterium]
MTEIINTETPSLTVPPELKRHEFFMQQALNEAKKAYALGEVPIGAVIVANDEILARGHNLSITSHDPTAHAEIVAIRNACQKIENYRLLNVDLYVTLE